MKRYPELTDEELAIRLKDGDEFAFTEIYRRYWKKMFVVAAKRLANEDEAQEIAQDIFLSLWKKRERFNLTTGFSNYFSVALKFEILDVLRKRLHTTTYERQLGYTFSEADESTLRDLEMADLQHQLKLTVAALPEKCQLVFNLQQDLGYSQREIAETLNISEKTVEAHLSKARKTLRAAFGALFTLMLLFKF